LALFNNDADKLINQAEKLAENLARLKVKSHQMRRIFEQVQHINDKVIHSGFSGVQREIKMLKPQLAYAVHRKPELRELHSEFSALVDLIKTGEDMSEFYDYLTAVMCYHKFYSDD